MRVKLKFYEIIQVYFNLIALLNPKPASNYSTNINENIIPGVVIEQQKDRWVVTANDFFLPKLRISNSYKSILGHCPPLNPYAPMIGLIPM